MKGLLQQIDATVRLHFRNRLALLYSYLFPTIFLVAFWTIYRHDSVPIARHLGELLTVTALGGACFGLPTTMVSERERGVWRRYRLTPVPALSLVGSTLVARYVLLVTAAALQLGLAFALGMPVPRHPLDLWIAFTAVAFALLGLGLVIAMMADNVPAVQALGQCIFLPMLIVGGIAVPIATLPEWAHHVSAFFPGRYAVEALQASSTGDGIGAAGFAIAALLLTGAAGCLASAMMFRWDAAQRFADTDGKGWIAVALAAWVAIGVAAESRGVPVTFLSAANTSSPAVIQNSARPRAEIMTSVPIPVNVSPPVREKPPATAPAGAPPWRAVTIDDIKRDVDFDRLPPDEEYISPLAPERERGNPDLPPPLVQDLDRLGRALDTWNPGRVADPVQRARNYLYVAAVSDIHQEPLERHTPWLVFDRLQREIPNEHLTQILYWIARNPDEGNDGALDELQALGLGERPRNGVEPRKRVAFYALKLLGRLIGTIRRDV